MPVDDPAAAETSSPYPDALPLSPRAERLLLGSDPVTAARLSAVAGVLFVATFLVHLPPRLFELTYPSATVLNALAIGSTLSVAVGTIGFVVGAGASRLVERVA